MPKFANPRRFAEVWQMGADSPGTLDQQQVVRDTLEVGFGTIQHKWLKRLDAHVNAGQRHYITIDFVPMEFLGLAFTNGVLLSDRLVPEGIRSVLPHEVGHVHDQNFLTQPEKDWFMQEVRSPEALPPYDTNWRHYQEAFADAFKAWWLGTGWAELTPILLGGANE